MTKTSAEIVAKSDLDTLARAMKWQFAQVGIAKGRYRLEVRLGDGRPAILLAGSSKTKMVAAIEGMLELVKLAGEISVDAENC